MLTTGEIAKLFQVSAQTVINWLDQGRIPFERIGRGPRRLTEENVLKYIEEIGISHSALDQTILQRTLNKSNSSSQKQKDAIAIINYEMMVIAWNEEVESLTGLPKSDTMGKSITSFIRGSDHPNPGFEYVIKNNWEKNSLETSVTFQSSKDKLKSLHLTASRFFSQNNLAGYVLVIQQANKA